MARTFAAYLTAPERCTLDNYWLRRSGEKRLIAWATTILRDDQGVMEYLVGMGTDLTTRREAEEAYAYLSLQTEMILNAAGDGIYGIDGSGYTTFINPAAARMLGYAPDELIGTLQHVITHHSRSDGTEYPIEQCPLYQVLREGTVRRVSDEVFWRKDGSCFPVEYVSTPMRRDGRSSAPYAPSPISPTASGRRPRSGIRPHMTRSPTCRIAPSCIAGLVRN